MTPYEEKPWLSSYNAGQPHTITPQFTDALSIFRAAADRAPASPAIHYFDATLSYAEVDTLSDALAVALSSRGCTRGERVALYLQNVPQFVIGLVAAWKLGAIAVPVNPMNRARELRLVLADSGAKVLICHESLYADVVSGLFDAERGGQGGGASPLALPEVITTSELDFQTRADPRLFAAAKRQSADGVPDLLALVQEHLGQSPAPVALSANDVAMLVYTSGTTGVPKGAMNTHGNVAFNAQVYRDWIGLREGGPILGVAPLFHITGLVGHVAAAFICAAPLVLACRFEPGVVLEAIRDRRVEFTIGSITVFIALMNHPEATREHFATLGKIYSGGAPIPPSVVEQFQARFGHYILDRKKDMIVAAGYKVWPREVEDVLYTHPAVREAAVVGIPDAYRGETVKAVVSLKPQASVTPEALLAWCKERMAAYKYPRVVEIIDELPKTVTGKILRRELRG
ncbi:long-chain-fatty-acid--CoA ligase [Cupriavidus basilensis OR16]|uniref:Long-chain-fatty-acid--CoA ligase n=1 Tax=Cupriavidus basilensis OR16 TaxID=1127483 RepID=H1S9B5_9BURK|nr:AMP-binding protein [Cupriavidus basilensis]EHP40839.1 long-chain-fatty-acid--CoA ligase [Cupriavidus basilensis OR16]